MAKDEQKRLTSEKLQADLDVLTAVKALTNYTPANADYTLVKMEGIKTKLDASQAGEVVAKNAWEAARDDAVAQEWVFHNAMLEAKTQVEAQYGKNSNEYQSLGLKKKSEYKRPTRKPKAAPSTAS
jgi:hypothetical protein